MVDFQSNEKLDTLLENCDIYTYYNMLKNMKNGTNEFINSLLTELSIRNVDGMPNLKREDDLQHIYQILIEWGFPYSFTDSFIQSLTEAEVELSKTAKSIINSKGLTHMGYGYYGKDDEAMYKKNEKGDLVSTTDDSYKKDVEDQQKKAGNVDKKKDGKRTTPQTKPTGGEEGPEPTSVFNTSSGDAYIKDLPDNDPAKQTKEPKTKTGVIDKNNFSQKSEATEGLFAGPKQYKTIESNGKSMTVRTLLDPKTGNPLDTSNPEDRKRALEILDERLNLLNDKTLNGIGILSKKGVPKTERTAVLKWLGEVGELQTYRSLLQSDKVKDVYLLTDSEPKNDLVIVGETEERDVQLKGVSVKTTEVNMMANKRGSSVKPDLENAINSAETRSLSIDGVDGDVDAGVMVNSLLEVRKRLIKEVSMDRVRQNPETKESEVRLDNGEYVSITEYFRQAKVNKDTIDKVFDNDAMFSGKNNPIRGLSNEKVDETQMQQIRQHLKEKLTKMVSERDITVEEMQNMIVDEFIDIYDKIGANLTPSTDTMVSYYGSGGFSENRIIPKEDYEKNITSVLGVKNFSEIDKRTQFMTVLGLDWTGRGAGKKKTGSGFIDGQSFGRPSPKLTPTPQSMDDYLDNILG